MTRRTKTDKAWEAMFQASFRKLSHGIQFNVMDLSKLERLARSRFCGHGDIDSAVAEAILAFKVS
jgi:hypothetical protein